MIDIIIPFYNRSDTIGRCLSSISMQTAKEKVIVTIVDDGSRDDEREKLVSIVKTFKKFLKINLVLLSENVGVGGARQKGIESSIGDWIMFLDSDDCLFSPLGISIINNEVQRLQPDIFLTRFVQETRNSIVDMPLKNQTWFHGKIYKRSFLEKNNIIVEPLRANEDSAFNTLAFALAENIKELNTVTYCWINNKNSMVRNTNEDYYGKYLYLFAQGQMLAIKKLKERSKGSSYEKEIINSIIAKDLVTFYYQYLDLEQNASSCFLKDFSKEVSTFLCVANYSNADKDLEEKIALEFAGRKVSFHYKEKIPAITFAQFISACLKEE